MQVQKIREKLEQRCLEKFGFKYFNQTKQFKEKMITTCLKNWGVDNYTKSEDWINYMKNGQAAYMNSCNRSPSWPQIKTYGNTCLVAPYPILNYPVYISKGKWYSVDIAIPQLGIAIEYDGSRHHQDKEKDDRKTKDLEEEGWNVLRYRDHIPSIKQLLQDINNILKV
jgi:hypothetical protein